LEASKGDLAFEELAPICVQRDIMVCAALQELRNMLFMVLNAAVIYYDEVINYLPEP